METNDERRKRKLRQLSEAHGLDALAEAAGLKGPESLDQILKGVLLPKKTDGTQSPRSLGDDSARKIELALNLGRGWFDEDWPFPMVDRTRWERLTPELRGYVQAAVIRALDECNAAETGAGWPAPSELSAASEDARRAAVLVDTVPADRRGVLLAYLNSIRGFVAQGLPVPFSAAPSAEASSAKGSRAPSAKRGRSR